MSLHRSLKTDKFKKKRSVRKRYERMRSLMLQEKWDKECSSVFALPKEKIIFKVKKSEEQKAKEAEKQSLVTTLKPETK